MGCADDDLYLQDGRMNAQQSEEVLTGYDEEMIVDFETHGVTNKLTSEVREI